MPIESTTWNITDANNVILTCALIASKNTKILNKEKLFKTLLCPKFKIFHHDNKIIEMNNMEGKC